MNLVQQNSTHLLLDSHEKLMKHSLLPLRKPYDTFQVSVFQRSICLMEADNEVPEGLSIELRSDMVNNGKMFIIQRYHLTDPFGDFFSSRMVKGKWLRSHKRL